MHTHDEEYMNMIREVLSVEDTIKDNRTAIKTIGISGYRAEYSLEDGYYTEDGDLVIPNFPLLTTKRVFWKAIVAELFWLLNGQTNIEFLEKNNVHIWLEWPHETYTKSNPDNPLTKEEFGKKIATDNAFALRWGDLGPIYGKQWRAWEQHVNNQVVPIDQVLKASNTLKNSPSSRRNIVNAWNVAEIEDMSLPPCHTLYQLLTNPDDEGYILDLSLYQRSLDTFLGAPFNIASYSLLLGIFACDAGMLPGTFIHMIGDCHLYVNHIEQVKEQMTREPYEGPTVTIKKGLLQKILELPINDPNLDYEGLAEYIVIEGYKAHPSLKGEVAV